MSGASSGSGRDSDPAKAAAYIRLSTLGFQVVITFVFLALGGYWLDGKIGSSPWGTLGGIGLALIAMVKILLQEGGGNRTSTAIARPETDDREEDSGEGNR
ncbi:MAG: AtpZ/AtpI family protein [Planctomycetota bacterium]